MASYADSDRTLTVQGLITYPDTLTQAITSTHISSFNINEDAGRDVPIGAAPASYFLLKLDNSSGQWEPGGSLLGAHSLDGAKVEIEIGLWNGSAYDYSKIGTYYVEDVRGQEHETTITLSGSDAMVPKMSAYFADAPGDYPRTIGALLVDVAAEAGVTLESSIFTNSNVFIPVQPNWRNDLTCRDVVGYIAACAGGIAKFNRDGKLEITTLERIASRAISTSVYKRLTRENTTFGALNAINIYAHGAPENTAPVRFATTPATPDTSLNSINIKGNPILANGSSTISSVGTGMLTALSGMSFRGATFDWHGDPTLVLGKICSVTDLASNSISVLITKQTIKFGAGFEMTSGCDVTTSTKADASNKLQKIFTPTGNLNAEALAGNIYVKAGEKMTLESGGNLNLLSGGNLNIKNLGNTANVINMDNTGLTLSSTGQLKLTSTDSIIIGGSPFGVGGTNLLAGTSETEAQAIFSSWQSSQLHQIPSKNIELLKKGGTFTLSAYLRNIAGTEVVGAGIHIIKTSGYFQANEATIAPGGEGIFSNTFEVPADPSYTSGHVWLRHNSITAGSSTVMYSRFKLEKSTQATDWSPSPEDPASGVKTASITIGDGGIDLTASDKITVSGGSFVETIAENVVTTASNSIVSTVKSDSDWLGKGAAASTYSTIAQTSDNIKLAVSGIQVGGTNLITNSDWTQGLDWAKHSNATVQYSSDSFDGKKYINVTCPAGTSAVYISRDTGPIDLSGDTEFTASVWYRLYSTQYAKWPVNGNFVQLAWFDGNGQMISFANFDQSHISTADGWQRFVGKATVPATAKKLRLTLYTLDNSGTANVCAYANAQVQEGNKVTPWGPHKDDPASGVKTSYIDIATDHIDISSGGNLSITSPNTLKITSGTTNATALAIRNDTDYFISAGHLTQSSAPFWIKKDGSIKSTSGNIGGFTIASSSLSAQPSGKPLLKLDAANSKIQTGVLEILGTSGPYGDAGIVGAGENELNLVGEPVIIGNVAYSLVEITNSVAWFRFDVSALSFTDRTIGYDGNAVADLKRIRNDKDGNIDHSTLPKIAKRTIQAKGKTEEGRDLGAMISILTKAVQELDERLEKIENRTK